MKKEHKLYAWVAGISTLVMVGAFVIPGEPADPRNLPWRYEHPSPDQLTIFGLTLGKSNAFDAEERFHEESKPSIFKTTDGAMVAEMYFEQVILVGLKSRVVLALDVPNTELDAMYQRGARMEATLTGKKVVPAEPDTPLLKKYPIRSLTYMPSAKVEPETFLKRFGEPASRIKETKSGVVHWLYPKIALDIAFGEGDRPVLQYVAPKDFEQLRKPLEQHGKPTT